MFRSLDLLFFTTIRQCKNTKITELKVNQIQFIVGKNAVHAGFRWVNNGVLKPALVEMYKREYIFDKQKCIELLKALSSQRSVQASYARKILAKMGINTD